MMNFSVNPSKFTPEGGSIELAAHQEGGEVQVKVRDNGPGIPPEEQKRIFEAFYRLRKSGEGPEGTGLGLAITESLVKLQGGSLGLESEPGHGSWFYFSLPIAKAAQEAQPHVAKLMRKQGETPTMLTILDDLRVAHLLGA